MPLEQTLSIELGEDFPAVWRDKRWSQNEAAAIESLWKKCAALTVERRLSGVVVSYQNHTSDYSQPLKFKDTTPATLKIILGNQGLTLWAETCGGGNLGISVAWFNSYSHRGKNFTFSDFLKKIATRGQSPDCPAVETLEDLFAAFSAPGPQHFSHGLYSGIFQIACQEVGLDYGTKSYFELYIERLIKLALPGPNNPLPRLAGVVGATPAGPA